jgi:hypothetical protein
MMLVRGVQRSACEPCAQGYPCALDVSCAMGARVDDEAWCVCALVGAACVASAYSWAAMQHAVSVLCATKEGADVKTRRRT